MKNDHQEIDHQNAKDRDPEADSEEVLEHQEEFIELVGSRGRVPPRGLPEGALRHVRRGG